MIEAGCFPGNAQGLLQAKLRLINQVRMITMRIIMMMIMRSILIIIMIIVMIILIMIIMIIVMIIVMIITTTIISELPVLSKAVEECAQTRVYGVDLALHLKYLPDIVWNHLKGKLGYLFYSIVVPEAN